MKPLKPPVMPLVYQPAQFLSVVQAGTSITRHADLLHWLQDDVQNYLPHDILIAGWGSFEEASVQHDIVSSLPGVRSYAAGTDCLPFLLTKMSDCWVSGGCRPRSLAFSEFSYLLGSAGLPDSFCEALRGMGSAVVHGISDKRSQNDCVYVFLSTTTLQSGETDAAAIAAVKVLLPVIDTALRQISHLPQQQVRPANAVTLKPASDDTNGLTERETQIMAWVAMGKTNLEIGSILNISGFTVKNHMQRIFQKLNVFNRAQAVSKVTRVAFDA